MGDRRGTLTSRVDTRDYRMPFEITIRRGDGLPLGRLDQVMSAISKAFPKVQFYREPSGMDKLAVLKEQGVEFPDVLRRHFEETPATLQGDHEGDGFRFGSSSVRAARRIRLMLRCGGTRNGFTHCSAIWRKLISG